MATRAPRPTRFSRESKATAVDIDQARAEVGRRIEKGTEQGKPFLRVVVPTPREPKPEQVIDLSFLYALPNLADTLAEAFWIGQPPHKGPRAVAEKRRIFAWDWWPSWLKLGGRR